MTYADTRRHDTNHDAGHSRPARHSFRVRNDTEPLIPILSRKVREVEGKSVGGKKLGPTNRVKFQVIALLMREERAKLKTSTDFDDATRGELLKRLEGIATTLAKIAARDTSLIVLLEPDASVSPVAQRFRRDWLLESGTELSPDDLIITTEAPKSETVASIPAELAEKQVLPESVRARQLAHPFLAPNLSSADHSSTPARRRLDSWELLGPLFKSFEHGSGGTVASMSLPEAPVIDRFAPSGTELMKHQARFLESVRLGHRSFLLADEPGLGKTAQSLLAASIANAYPLLAIVPNVVKMNWVREVNLWTPSRTATVIHGDGHGLDAFADVVIVNYEVLDRHLSWLGNLGFRSIVVDEAHFIKNMQSQRSKYVLGLADRIRHTAPNGSPLLMALTGTPLINDIDDFRAIWQFLGWIDGPKPTTELMNRLEETGYTPADPEFYPAARTAVINMGIVRRKKVDVAADLPSKRVADIPVELDDDLGRSIRRAERDLGKRLREKFIHMQRSKAAASLPRDELIRMVARNELNDSKTASTGENVFTMVRKIGYAKASLAADYAAQLVRSVGKVVFFAKHIDVLDQAEKAFASHGLTSVSIRGDQNAIVRQRAIDAFNDDPEVAVAVCSLLAAGVGLNLQASSNVVLAELSWTDAEQTQAIDRVHRIGQDEPVTAWRIIAAHTIDTKIADLIDSKASLASRALDGSDDELVSSDSVQLEALMHLLREALGEN